MQYDNKRSHKNGYYSSFQSTSFFGWLWQWDQTKWRPTKWRPPAPNWFASFWITQQFFANVLHCDFHGTIGVIDAKRAPFDGAPIVQQSSFSKSWNIGDWCFMALIIARVRLHRSTPNLNSFNQLTNEWIVKHPIKRQWRAVDEIEFIKPVGPQQLMA